MKRSRRAVLGSAAGMAGLLAGCTGDGDDADDGPTPAAVPSVTETGSDSYVTPLSVAHWLSDDGELAGYETMVDRFTTVTDARIEPSSGSGLSLTEGEMKRRIRRGYPPSVWQTSPGADLLSLTGGPYLQDISNTVWAQANLLAGYPDDVQRAVQTEGTHLSVPWAGQRTNTLFYNPSVTDRAGVDLSALDSPAALRSALVAIDQETDAVPLTWPGDVPWQLGQLFEAVLLAQTGVDGYRELLSTGADRAAVQAAMDTLWSLAAFAPEESPGEWAGTVGQVLDGEAAMVVASGRIVGGDASSTGFAARADATRGEDWAATPIPGTAGVVQFAADAFVPPQNNPTQSLTEQWLRFVGGPRAQRLYASAAGALPLRADVDTSALPGYVADQHAAYRQAEARVPSITNRLVLGPESYITFLQALFAFDTDTPDQSVTDSVVEALSTGNETPSGTDGSR